MTAIDDRRKGFSGLTSDVFLGFLRINGLNWLIGFWPCVMMHPAQPGPREQKQGETNRTARAPFLVFKTAETWRWRPSWEDGGSPSWTLWDPSFAPDRPSVYFTCRGHLLGLLAR